MTPLRQPLTVHGHTPGLIDDWGGPTLIKARGSDDWQPESVVRRRDGIGRMTWLGRLCRLEPDHVRLDMARPECIYGCLHWLADRGHPCLWMLPESHGGKVEGWDGLSAWDVSAILVSASVARVAAGRGPVTDLLHVSEIGNNAGCSGTVRWYAHRSLRTGGHPYVAEAGKPISGPRVDDREAVLLRALADGAALLVEGGVVVRTPGAP